MDDFELQMKKIFLDEAEQMLADTEQCFVTLETTGYNPEMIEKIFRLAHSIKGSSSAVGFTQFSGFTHQLESLLLKVKNREFDLTTDIVDVLLKCNDRLREMVAGLREDNNAQFDNSALVAVLASLLGGGGVKPAPAAPPPPAEDDGIVFLADFVPEPPKAQAAEPPKAVPVAKPQTPAVPHHTPPKADESIRVDLSKIDTLLNNVGELVILQTVLHQHKHTLASTLLQKTISQLSKIAAEIQDISMSLRMISLKTTFQKMQRIVRDTSKALQKDVRFETFGEDTELDKTVLEQISDPLVHLVRNAVDHGIEPAEDRAKAGKPAQGTVRLRAFHKADRIVIEICEDGRGLDAEKLKSKAIEKGIIAANNNMSDEEAYRLIFAPGFSTKTEVTDISGRGVGMDVVKTNIEQLQGEIQLDTKLGEGTTFRILLPLTLAIVDGIIITSADERYVIPMSHVHESIRPGANDIATITGRHETLIVRGEALPLLRLPAMLGRTASARSPCDSIAMVVREGARPFAVLVDDIIGQQQVVIKRLGDEISGLRGVTGGAILGDGKAALILDLTQMKEVA